MSGNILATRPMSAQVECSYDWRPNGRPLCTQMLRMPSAARLLDHPHADVVGEVEAAAVRPPLRVAS